MTDTPASEGFLDKAEDFAVRSFANRFWDWSAVLLTIGLVQLASLRLVVTDWAPFLYFAQTLAFWGTVLGLLLGLSTFKRPTVLRIVNGYSLIVLPWLWLHAIERTDRLMIDLVTLAERLFSALGVFLQNQPVEDTLFFVVIVSTGFWVIGLWAGYQLTRHKDFLDVVLPAGLAMITIQFYDQEKGAWVWSLALFLFGALLLLGRLYFIENKPMWRKNRVYIAPEALKETTNSVLITAFIAVMVAWSLPGLISNIQSAAQTWNRITHSTFNRLSNATQSLKTTYTTNLGGDFYGTQIELGQKTATGSEPAFTVQIRNNKFIPPRMYWTGRVYDQYSNGQWSSSPTVSGDFSPAADNIQVERASNAREIGLIFTYQFKKQSLLYVPPDTTWVSRPSSLFTFTDAGTLPDVNAWVADSALGQGNSYEVNAWIGDPSVEELRAAGTDYPSWVTDRYLQVPQAVTSQLRVLTEQITAPYDTPYDKAAAITAYLRQEITYSPELNQAPPQNMDPVLWVVFDYKRGFCMYYASAETLMLRTIGIPARFAVGFAEGTFDDLHGKYTVTYMNSHAWPEVYFPGIGWVEFEPTGNQSPLIRPETNADALNNGNGFISNSQLQLGKEEVSPPDSSTTLSLTIATGTAHRVTPKISAWFFVLGFLLVVVAIVLVYLHRYPIHEPLPVYLAGRFTHENGHPPTWLASWIRWEQLSELEKSFQAINLSLHWLRHPQSISATSTERANLLVNYLPEAEHEIAILLKEYQDMIYTPQVGNALLARRMAFSILWKAWKKGRRKSQYSNNNRYN